MEADCRDDVHASVYLTDEFDAESDSAVCDDFLELCDDTDRALLILSRGASKGGHMSKNTSCPLTEDVAISDELSSNPISLLLSARTSA